MHPQSQQGHDPPIIHSLTYLSQLDPHAGLLLSDNMQQQQCN